MIDRYWTSTSFCLPLNGVGNGYQTALCPGNTDAALTYNRPAIDAQIALASKKRHVLNKIAQNTVHFSSLSISYPELRLFRP